MSADRWGVCPNCKRIHDDKAAKEAKRLEGMYGKVSIDEFLTRKKTHDALVNAPMPTNLREDWGVGMDEDGNFSFEYYASCRECGWEFSHKHEQKAVGVGEVKK